MMFTYWGVISNTATIIENLSVGGTLANKKQKKLQTKQIGTEILPQQV